MTDLPQFGIFVPQLGLEADAVIAAPATRPAAANGAVVRGAGPAGVDARAAAPTGAG